MNEEELETVGTVVCFFCIGLTLYCIICWDSYHKPATSFEDDS